jgi:hypothetical protein
LGTNAVSVEVHDSGIPIVKYAWTIAGDCRLGRRCMPAISL